MSAPPAGRQELPVEQAAVLATSLLRAQGMPAREAGLTATALVIADQWGTASHGLVRLPPYLRRLAAGGINPRAELREVRRRPALVTYDGERGMGHWQVFDAADAACELARASGIGIVAVGDSNHCGCLGVYTRPGLAEGFATLVLSNGPAVMPPWGGRGAVLSTSPIAAGLPLAGAPAIIDLSLSHVARGRILEHAVAGTPIPPAWAFDVQGRPTTDPQAALAGTLAPMAGAKGYALALLVEALTAAFVGPALSRDVADMLNDAHRERPQRIAHLVLALDVVALDVDGCAGERSRDLVQAVAAAGGRLPGARRLTPSADPRITLPAATIAQLRKWATRSGVDASPLAPRT